MGTTYHGDCFEMYRNIKSLCCVPGTNLVLLVNYTSKTNKQKNGWSSEAPVALMSRVRERKMKKSRDKPTWLSSEKESIEF